MLVLGTCKGRSGLEETWLAGPGDRQAGLVLRCALLLGSSELMPGERSFCRGKKKPRNHVLGILPFTGLGFSGSTGIATAWES